MFLKLHVNIIIVLSIFLCNIENVFSQESTNTEMADSKNSELKIYRAVPTKYVDLKHVKLEASFNYSKSQLNGKAWLTMLPHLYATDSIVLDAKGMDIHALQLVTKKNNEDLQYTYDSLELHIKLPRFYSRKDTIKLYIHYTAKPNQYKGNGSKAITSAKGLYFINPLGTELNKPRQIWTQGETEGTSVWLPIVDKNNQKLTQEFILTYPEQFVSLSNGKLIKQNKKDGFKTDYWVMDMPHAPYLMFLGIGDFAIVKDNYKGKEVSYYVEKDYEPVARKIFGNTPEMIDFFSKRLAIEYPWNKYSQMVARDYVSGAMENTTAVLHQESAQQDARELKDANQWETVIAHELFHHWFGDLTTAESWSNLTVNESFADYSQLLWLEYKYGKDFAEFENFNSMRAYLSDPTAKEKDLVRFYYKNQEDMFDVVSYQKGGRILHMLRGILGDDAFFGGLTKYLNQNRFGTGNAHKLRLALEEVSGKDLNWYFNQWYFGSGHPDVKLDYKYLDNNTLKIFIEQKQKKLFILPLQIDIYSNNNKERFSINAKNKFDTFEFRCFGKPDLVNIDPEKTTLWTKKENKSWQEYIFQYQHALNYLDRREAVEVLAKNLSNKEVRDFMFEVFKKDTFHAIQALALKSLNGNYFDSAYLPNIISIAQNPKYYYTVRDLAVQIIAQQKSLKYLSLLKKLIDDSSYTISGAALQGVYLIDSVEGLKMAKSFMNQKIKKNLLSTTLNIIIDTKDSTNLDFILNRFTNMNLDLEKFNLVAPIGNFLAAINGLDNMKKGVEALIVFKKSFPDSYQNQIEDYLNNLVFQPLIASKVKQNQTELVNYLEFIIKNP